MNLTGFVEQSGERPTLLNHLGLESLLLVGGVLGQRVHNLFPVCMESVGNSVGLRVLCGPDTTTRMVVDTIAMLLLREDEVPEFLEGKKSVHDYKYVNKYAKILVNTCGDKLGNLKINKGFDLGLGKRN